MIVMSISSERSQKGEKRLKGDGEAVGLEVDEVALGVAGLAASGDVGTAGLLDGDGDCWSSSLALNHFRQSVLKIE